MNLHFASLVAGLAHQAEDALSGKLPAGAADSGQGDARQLARMLIDTLGMLEQKTQGHLEADELRLLSDFLTALRFRFVQSAPKG